MKDILKILTTMPVSKLLIIAGIAFLFIAAVTKIGDKINLDKQGRLITSIIGVVLLLTGIVMHFNVPSLLELSESQKYVNIMSKDKCLDIADEFSHDGVQVVIRDCNQQNNQRWQIINNSIKGFEGRCLDINGEQSIDGAKIILWPCHGRNNQRWRIVNESIKGLDNKCLDVDGDKFTNGNKVLLWSCHEQQNQRWVIKEEKSQGVTAS